MNNWMHAHELSKEHRRQAEATAEREQNAAVYTVRHVSKGRVLTLLTLVKTQLGAGAISERLAPASRSEKAQLRMRKA